MTRRKFIYFTALISGGIVMACNRNSKELIPITQSFSMPHEGEKHERSWLCFVSNSLLSPQQSKEIKYNLVSIAIMIAKYEPLSILVAKQDKAELIALLGDLNAYHYPISLVECPLDSFYLRDMATVFVKDSKGKKAGLDFNFLAWKKEDDEKAYLKLHDPKVASFLCKQSRIKSIASNIILKGGAFEVDGEGTALMSESDILDEMYNPDLEKEFIETELKQLLGLEKIIWLKGNSNKHKSTDFYVRFVRQGVVLVAIDNYQDSEDYARTRENIALLKASSDAQGNPLEVHTIAMPNFIDDSYGVENFLGGYLGYYECNHAIIMQKFGDTQSDKKARDTLKTLFPLKNIEQINLDALSSAGGSIHRATLQEFAI